jgi:hypothetical protein
MRSWDGEIELVGPAYILNHHHPSRSCWRCVLPQPPDRYTPIQGVGAIAHVHTHTQHSGPLEVRGLDLKTTVAHDFLACPARAE